MKPCWKGVPEGNARVAVTGVGGNVGQGILKALAAAGTASWVVGTDVLGQSAGLYLVDRGYRVPNASSPQFEDAFCRILEHEKIDIALIAADAEIVHLARIGPSIQARTGTRVLVAAPEVVETCQDKWRTASWFAAAGLPHPPTVLADDRDGVLGLFASSKGKVVVKPRSGFGSRDVMTIDNQAEALAAAARLGQHGIVQHHVGTEDQEYTAAVLCGAGGAAMAGLVMWREIHQGTSYRVHPLTETPLLETLLGWASRLGATGPVNFQFRLTEDGPVCFEINPRFSGTTGLRHHFGFNDVDMAVRHFVHGEPIRQPELRQGVVMRYWEEVFIPQVSWPEVAGGKLLEREPGEL